MIETIIPDPGIRTPDPDFSHRVGKSIESQIRKTVGGLNLTTSTHLAKDGFIQ
jgi:hypothetical protein